MRTSFLALILVGALATPALAQTTGGQAKPPQKPVPQKPVPAQTTKPKPKPVPKLPLGFRGFAAFETTSMSASSTFNAITGSGSVTGFGAGGEVLNVWRKMFVRFGFSKASADGDRGYGTDDGRFVATGIPVTIGVRNIEIAAGWRTYLRRRPKFALYGGGGLLIGSVSQESPFATGGENSSKRGTGFVVMAGLEYAASKYIVAGVEAQFRRVGGGVLGTGESVSEAFGETNAGGAAIRGIIGFRYRR